MKLWLTFAPLMACIFSSVVCAERLKDTYEALLRSERNAPPPSYYLASLTTERTTTDAKTTEEASAETKSVIDTINAQMTSSKKDSADPAKRPLFYDFNSEEFLAARKLANSDALDKTPAQPVPLNFLLAAAFERNPNIAALQRSWKATIERYPQSLYLDNILKQYNAFTKQLHTRTTGNQRQKEMVTMSFPAPGTVSLKAQIIQRDVQIAAEDYQAGVRDVMTNVRMAYYDYLYILKSIEITEENRKLLSDFEITARSKYEGNRATFSDVIKAQVELSKLMDVLITLKEERDTIIARINTLVSRDPHSKLGEPIDFEDRPLPTGEYYELAVAQQQEIKRLQLLIEKMDLVIALSRKMARPDPSAGASYFENRSGILGGSGSQPAAFNPSPQIKHRFWFGTEDAYLTELQTKREALTETLRARKNETHFELKNTRFQLDAAKRQRDLYEKTLLPQARQNLQTARIAYQSAKVGFLDLLDAERLWLGFNLAEHNFIRNYRKQYARLEQVIGKRL